MVIDYWELLEIKPTTDITVIKKAYASGVKKYHPEEHPHEFQQLQKAYKKALCYAKQYQPKQTGWNTESTQINTNNEQLSKNPVSKDTLDKDSININEETFRKEKTNKESDNKEPISRELDNKEQADKSALSKEALSKVAHSTESSNKKSSQNQSFDSASQILTIPQNLFDDISITSYRHTDSTDKKEDSEQLDFKVVEECSEDELNDKKIKSFMKEFKNAFKVADNFNKDTYWLKLFSTAQFRELQANPKFTEEFLTVLSEAKELFDTKLWKQVFVPMLRDWPYNEIIKKFNNKFHYIKKAKPKRKISIFIIILTIWYALYFIFQMNKADDSKVNDQKYIAADETTDSKTNDKPEPQIVKKNHDGTYFFTEDEVNKILKNSEDNLGAPIYVKSMFSDDYNETSYYELYFFICVEESDNVYVEVYRKYDNNKIEQTVSMLSEKTKKQNIFPEGLEGYEFTGNYDYKNNNK